MTKMNPKLLDFVNLDGNQTINGNKTFSKPITVNAAPTADNHVVRLQDLNSHRSWAYGTINSDKSLTGNVANANIAHSFDNVLTSNSNDFSSSNGHIKCNKAMTVKATIYYPYFYNGTSNFGAMIYCNWTRGHWISSTSGNGGSKIISYSMIFDVKQNDEIYIDTYIANANQSVTLYSGASIFVEKLK